VGSAITKVWPWREPIEIREPIYEFVHGKREREKKRGREREKEGGSEKEKEKEKERGSEKEIERE
jgi:hypothetical protein